VTTIRITARGDAGRALLDVLQDAAIPIATECGGSGRCGLCVVRVSQGDEWLTRPRRIEREIVGSEARLACQAEIVGDGEVVIEVPDPLEMLTRGLP
jgi:ferredoxin